MPHTNLLSYVNTKQGSDSCRRFSGGNALPLTQLPFGMASFVPQTQGANAPYFYHPRHRSLEGVRLTHQASPWLTDYGSILLSPQVGENPHDNPERFWTSYRPEEAVLAPDYIRLRFLRYRTDMEVTPTERGGVFRLQYEEGAQAWLSLLPTRGCYEYRIDSSADVVYAQTDGHGGDKAENFTAHFALRFPAGAINREKTHAAHNTEGLHIALNAHSLSFRISTSYISAEQALRNLEQDTLAAADFPAARAAAAAAWQERLSKLEPPSHAEEDMRTFYSCLYRVHLYPHKAYEIDADGSPIHYSPNTGKVFPGPRYTGTGFWDTARTQFMLLMDIAPQDAAAMVEGFIGEYTEGGWLPRWLNIGECGCMPSTHVDAVIAEAVVRGLLSGSLAETALEGMLHHANHDSPDSRFGREGAESYVKYGYVPYDLHPRLHTVNRTLDDAYGDWCIAQVAHALGKAEVEAEYRRRAGNYRNLFDPESGFMRGKDSQGHFRPHFNPIDWGGDYCEGSAWQNSDYVPHDPQGLADLHGGTAAYLQRLDKLFATPPAYNVGSYGAEIHEMSEMAAVDFGQCAISNQPSFHIPFLYAALGAPEKTRYWVERLLTAFSAADNGFPGDEDNGSMAAWYIFAALGKYPLCPGSGAYVSF